MSDLSLRLQQAASQLPVASYFDEAIYQREQSRIFQCGPRYVGHELAVPEIGDYYTLPHEAGGRALVRTTQGVELISNVCRHRQALMLKGRGSLLTEQPGSAFGNIVCPLHRWTYSGGGAAAAGKTGTLIGAPHFPQDPCLNLDNYALQQWNGLLFEAARPGTGPGVSVASDLAGLGPLADLDFSGHVLDHVEMHECDYNWKTFIEVYLEDYHVVPFHPGLGNFVTCKDLTWQFGDWYSVQKVGITSLAKPGSATYAKWHKAVLDYYGEKRPTHGAIWLTYYPNIMVEWYPHVLVVSTLIPTDIDRTTNVVEFYYPEDIAEFEREFVDAEQAAYMETAIEDDEIGERMDRGRRALMKEGRNEVGPYQSPFEDGMQHFHEFYRRIMEPHIGG